MAINMNLSKDFSIVTQLPPTMRKAISVGVNTLILPFLGIAMFLLFWSISAQNINTSLGAFPGPTKVMHQFSSLYGEHKAERIKEQEFFVRQDVRNAERIAEDPTYEPKTRVYTGKETFLDQIVTSLITVICGFILAMFIAIPLGIAIGLSEMLSTAVNPVIQLLKPISPLAWLPLVTMVVSGMYVTPDPIVPKAFLTSMITVSLCSLWPTLISTAVGASSVNKDLINVSKVLNLSALTHVWKIVIPATIPMIFTGMRLSIGVAWMVLIAAEMLAQNPGLGKFVWDEFQNGSSDSLSRILAAALVIGLIGFLLDRGMLAIQRYVSWDEDSAKR